MNNPVKVFEHASMVARVAKRTASAVTESKLNEDYGPVVHKYVSQVSEELEWSVSGAMYFCVRLLEDVNAHSEGRAVQKLFERANWGYGKQAASRLDGVRKHKLMPNEIRSKLPKLYSQEDVKDPIAQLKLFSPYSGATWYITEFDGHDTMFGWADLGHGGGELGYISLSELEEANRNGLPLVERDKYFRPEPLSKLK
jgi:hypothetical protein